MTSERYNPLFLGAHSGKHGPVLPASLGERLRSSFESLQESTSEDGKSVEDSMEMSLMQEMEPDYGDEAGDRDSGQSSSIHSGELSTLPDLTDESVLDVVRARYKRDLIYTSCGDVLISINPFKQLNIFDEATHEAYSLDALSSDVHLQPHVFWVASQAIARRARDKNDQVVLVSGESGAGKTEATKLMLRHILHLSASRQDRLFESIDKVNPLLEQFGNARTVLNDNSSRFAKFLDVRFSPDGAVTGAIIRDYILEKSRVVRPSPRESNFHIFYTFLDDVMASPERQKLFLMEGMDKSHFRIVPRDSWKHSGSRMSSQEQAKVFRQIGIPQEEVDNMHVILAAILHLSNIRFVEEDSSSGGVVVENEDTMNKAACLLSVDPEKLATVLVTTKATFSGEEIMTFKSHSKADETRDAIAKALYERLFGWLIRRINSALNRVFTSEAGIGFLDICGFEDLAKNSLEQLCINLSNEHLQKFMNTQVFEQEMKIYRQEGIVLEKVIPPSNEDILDLFNRPKTGILALVNEDTKHMELATDKTMVRKIIDRHAHSHHFLRYKNDDPRFGIKHFAVPVWYCAEDFLRKNGDTLSKESQDIMVASSNELVSDIFQVQKSSTGSIAPTQYNYRASKRRDTRFSPFGQTSISMSVLTSLRQSLKGRFGSNVPKVEGRTQPADQNTAIDYFQESMRDLLRKMEKAQPLFVRCIKPNDMQEPDRFEDRKVQLQLRYNGVTEIARIRRVWFPVRIQYTAFLKKYCELSPKAKGIANKSEAVRTILRLLSVGREQYKTGRTMVFLKDEVCAKLEKELEEVKRKKREEEERQKREEEKRKRREEEERKKAEEEQKRKEEEERKKKMAAAGRQKHVHLAGLEMDTIAEADTPLSSIRSASPFKTSSGSSVAAQRTDNTEVKVPIGSGASSEGERQTSEREQPPSDDAEDDKKNDFWDIFRIVAREQPTTDIHHMRAMKIIKFIVYFFLFVIVLVTATAQKVSLMLMLFAVSPEITKQADPSVPSAYYILVVVAMCLPYILTFLTSLAKVAFGGFRNPSVATWLWVLVIESLHTFGLVFLVFRVLPRLDVVRGLLLLCSVAVLPSLLKPVMGVEIRGQRLRNFLCVVSGVLDFLAMAGQLSVLPVIILLDYVPKADDDVLNVPSVVGAVVCVSFTCWENFMDGKFFVQLRERNAFKNFVLKRRFELERGRYIPQLVTSVWKIVLTVLLAYFFRDERNFDYQSAFTSLGELGVELRAVTAIAVLTLSGLVCYYFSYIACKLWMQKISFSMPLAMATPCAILVFYLDTHYNFLTEVTPNGSKNTKIWPDNLLSDWAALVSGVAWFVSLLILTRHIWFPRQTRLAKIEMLFMNPLYCGILTTESLLLNRRRHTLSCRKKRDANSILYYRLDHNEHARNSGESDYASGSGMYSEIGHDSSGQILDEENVYGGAQVKKGEEDIPMIYACATMWHEVRREMVALLKSLHRIDLEQWTRKQAQDMSKTRDKDFFDYEAHIFFDDAMTLDDDEEFVPNDYVKMLVEVMEEAVSSVYKKAMTVAPPFKIPTPYGGQLLWLMPGGNLLFVHLKDKAKIRHRKRWSQVMYMYYLLGFRLTRQCQQQILEALQNRRGDEQYAWAANDEATGNTIFEMLDDSIAQKSQNTFVMALDGDTDFYPGAVHILLDRMKKNPKVGAACGRIHPIGSGPMVWYQMFEYAIGHWMQKATEHVLGCVLCSPGCFSLFRGSALMDDNVMRMYTILPTEPGHFLQYDQGEDRWLCTLLLQQGYRVDYAAAADAWTYAPEGFNEFFNQRRRWMPSTLANVMDLLSDYSKTVAVNSNISMLYIIYQVALMVATLLGPGTVLMMIAGAIGVVFSLDLIWSYIITLVPAIIFIIVCFCCKTQTQLFVAGILSTFYAFVMMIVFVGTIVTAVEKSIFHPSVLVIAILVIIFLLAGICHPLEIYCLPSGALYLLCIPSGYLLLVIYSLCNLHIVSWGTREAPKKKTKAELEQEKLEEEKKKAEKAKKKGFFSGLLFSNHLNDLKEIIQTTTGRKTISADEDKSLKLLMQINENLIKLNNGKGTDSGDSSATGLQEVAVDSNPKPAPERTARGSKKKSVSIAPAQEVIEDKPEAAPAKPTRNELKNPKWVEDKGLGDGEVMKLFDEECIFWKRFLARYLKPLEADKQKEKEDTQKLIELRNSVCFGVGMINLLWIAVNFMFQLTNPVTVTIPLDGGIDVGIMGLLFVFFLLAVLLLQLVGMIIHRWGTLLHLLAFTDISCPCFQTKMLDAKEQKERDLRKAFDFCQELVREPMPDYVDEGAQDGSRTARAKLAATIKQKLQQSVVGSQSIQRQTVTQQLMNNNVISGPGFLNSNSVRLYLQATRRADEEDDQTARDFVGNFRSVMSGRARGQHSQRNGYARQFSGSSGNSQRVDGFPPPVPRRPGNVSNMGVRRRIHANNLRYTARDVIDKARDRGINIEDPRGRGGGQMAEDFGGGMMDRAFSRRVRMFSQYASGPGRSYVTGIEDV